MPVFKHFLPSLLLWTGGAVADEPGPVQPDCTRSGAYQIEMSITDAAGPEIAKAASQAIKPDESISWEIYVPDSFDDSHAPGLFVYINALPSGKIPHKWKPVMGEMNLIWIAANQSGNTVSSKRRSIFALVAPYLVSKCYRLNANRIYIAGASGGAKVASMVAPGTTHLFKGAVYMIGAKFWDDYPHDPVEQIRRNRFVFITGTEDSGLQSTRRTFTKYQKAGVENSKLIVVRDMGHRLPDPEYLIQAIQYLDTPAELPSQHLQD